MAPQLKTTKQKKEKEVTIPLYSWDGKTVDTLTFPQSLIATEVSPVTFAQYIRVYLANQRQGTASQKTRAEVQASTRKIYRQKGTGNARHGSVKAPIFVGGGATFAIKPRDFSLKLNKKQKKAALKYALKEQLKQEALVAFEPSITKPSTKEANNLIKTIGAKKALVVLPKMENNAVVQSFRNLKNVELIQADSLNAYVVARYQKILFAKDALPVIEERFNV